MFCRCFTTNILRAKVCDALLTVFRAEGSTKTQGRWKPSKVEWTDNMVLYVFKCVQQSASDDTHMLYNTEAL